MLLELIIPSMVPSPYLPTRYSVSREVCAHVNSSRLDSRYQVPGGFFNIFVLPNSSMIKATSLFLPPASSP